jgi:predicted nucleic acid-binding protein
MDCFWVDTNIIIRFLMNDHEKHSAAARKIMNKVQRGDIQLYLNPIVAAECCYILHNGPYNKSRRDIVQTLTQLFKHPNIIADNKLAIIDAIQALKINSRLSFEDGYVAAVAKSHQINKILTYNERDFRKLNVEHYTPLELL